jgi:hypothetical protein
VFSIILGVGLVALMFYSNRHGYDEPPSKPPRGFSEWPLGKSGRNTTHFDG